MSVNREPAAHGLLVIDKPVGLTSRDAVDRVQACFPRGTRIGHAGTLDPLASGVLVVCIGKATRFIEHVQAMQKTYRTRFHLGATSATDDAEGPITPVEHSRLPDREQVASALTHFMGNIKQTPPCFSAAKVTGRRAYKLARRGKKVELAPRVVRIDAIRLLDFGYPALDLEIDCGKGTYIRSLARDLGERLGCGGYVESLRRTRIGVFALEQAAADPAAARLLPIELAVADLPRVELNEEESWRLMHGQAIPRDVPHIDQGNVAVFGQRGLVAVARMEGGCVRPVKVLS